MPCYLLSSEGDILETTDGDLLIVDGDSGFNYPLTATISTESYTVVIDGE